MIKLRKQDRYEYVVRWCVGRYGDRLPYNSETSIGMISENKDEITEYVYALNLAMFGSPDNMAKYPDAQFKVMQATAEKVDLAMEVCKIEATKLFDIHGAYSAFHNDEMTVVQLNAVLNAANMYVEKNIDFITPDDIALLERDNEVLKGINAKSSLEEKSSLMFSMSTPTGGRKHVTLIKVCDEFTGNTWHENPLEKPDQMAWNPYTGGSSVTLFRGSKKAKLSYSTTSVETRIPVYIKRAKINEGTNLSDEQLLAAAFEAKTNNVQKLTIYLRNLGGSNRQVKRLYPQLKVKCHA